MPLWRSLVVNQGESAELRQRVVGLRERLVGRLESMYAPELSTLPDGERRHLLIVLESLVDVESWARMQEFFGLSFDEVLRGVGAGDRPFAAADATGGVTPAL